MKRSLHRIASVVAVIGFTALGICNLNEIATRNTDSGLSQLSGLTSLKRLQLHESSVTDAGLVHI
jgi:hypothetical protein